MGKSDILTIFDHILPVCSRSPELRDRERCTSEGDHAATRLINTLPEPLLGFRRLDVVPSLGVCFNVERGGKAEAGRQAQTLH